MCCALRISRWTRQSWTWCGQMPHSVPARYFRLSVTASPSKPPPVPSTFHTKVEGLDVYFFQRPRKVSPPGKLTQKPPRELRVTGPSLVEVDAPEPENLTQLFWLTFLRFREYSPIQKTLAQPGRFSHEMMEDHNKD